MLVAETDFIIRRLSALPNFVKLASQVYILSRQMISNNTQVTFHDPGPPLIEHDIEHASDRYLLKLKSYAKALPYSIESNSRMQGLLDFICIRIVQTVQARDYDPGFLQWDSMLT